MLGRQQDLGPNLEGALNRGVIGRDVRLAGARGEYDQRPFLEMLDGAQANIRLGDRIDRNGRHDSNFTIAAGAQGATQDQAIHDSCHDPDVVRLGTLDSPLVSQAPTENVSATNNHGYLDTVLREFHKFVGQEVDRRLVEAKLARARQGAPAQFDQYSGVSRHGVPPSGAPLI